MTFSTELKSLAQEALADRRFELKSGYASKRERLCRRYLSMSDEMLNNLSRLYPSAQDLFSKSALEQRIAFSLIEALYFYKDLKYARREIDALLAELDEVVYPKKWRIQERLNHTTDAAAKIIFDAAKHWGFIKTDSDGFIVVNRNNDLLNEIRYK